MSKRVVGYEGEGRTRRAIYVDEGPASVAVAHGSVAALSAVTDADVRRLTGGAGAVEITRVQVDEVTPREAREARTGPSGIAGDVHAQRMQISRQRGSERHVALVAARKPAPPEGPPVSSEPVHIVSTDSPVHPFDDEITPTAVDDQRTRLRALQAAASEAEDAWMVKVAADVAATAAQQAWDAAHEALTRKALAAVMDEPEPDPEVGYEIPVPPHAVAGDVEQGPLDAADLIDLESATTIEMAVGEPEPIGRAPVDLPLVVTKQDAILGAVVRLNGDLKAIAAERNTTSGNVTATLHNAGKRRRLTVEMIAVLPAAFAKYSGV